MGEVHHSVGVAPLVVVPGDDLDESGAEGDTGVSIEDRRARVSGEVLRDDGVLSISKDALELVLRSSLDALLDLVVAGIAGKSDGEVDDRDVSRGHAEGHTGELAVELGNDLADSLGGTSGGRNNVGASSTSSAPVLAALGGTIDSKLVDGDGVDGGHETLFNAPGIVKDLGYGGKAVGRAASVGDDSHGGVVLVLVNTHDEDGRGVLRGSRDDSLLSTALKVSTSVVSGAEHTSALSNVVGTDAAPRDLAGISLLEDVDLLAVDKDATISLLDGALEAA